MAITRITIENFKGIAERVEVDLKPITVLFGANSAGKSTLLQAMLYLRELLERRNADADRLQARGSSIDLGGFRQLVHGHDPSREVKIEVTVEVSDDGLPVIPVVELALVNAASADFMENGISGVQTVGVEIGIRWDADRQCPQIHSYAVSLNGSYFAKLEAESALQCYLVDFEPWHDEFPSEIRSEPDLEDDSIPASQLSSYLQRENLLDLFGLDMEDTENQVAYRVPLGSTSVIPNWDQLILPKKSFEQIHQNDQMLSADIDELSEYAIAQFILSQIMVGAGRTVLEELQKICYVGPLRTLPDRNFVGMRSPKEDRWADGMAAWDRLYESAMIPDGNALVMETSGWLNDPEKLNMGYNLESRAIYEVEDDSYAMYLLHSLAANPEDDDIAERMNQIIKDIEDSPRTIRLSLRDLSSGTIVAPCDIGVGVSQVIPVVVASIDMSGNTVAIEQPELHLHPAVQARLGDLFLEAATDGGEKRFILETHSEHLMLRFLRRIRECSEDDKENYPSFLGDVSPEDVSVYYIQSLDHQTKMTPLRISEDGDFLDRWPNGFFEERGEELF